MIRRWLCKVFGHRVHEDENGKHPNPWCCDRCGDSWWDRATLSPRRYPHKEPK